MQANQKCGTQISVLLSEEFFEATPLITSPKGFFSVGTEDLWGKGGVAGEGLVVKSRGGESFNCTLSNNA